MRIKQICVAGHRFLTPVFLATLFWQSRFAVTAGSQVIDYLIPFVYLGDLLLLLLLCIEFVLDPRWMIHLWNERVIRQLLILFGVWVLIVVFHLMWGGIVFPVAVYYKLFRLGLMILLVLWLVRVFSRWGGFRIMIFVTAGLVPLILIGIGELILGHSLGFQMIGEWNFSVMTPGIAKAIWGDLVFLRPYATFPHPNVFGAVMGGTLVFWLTNFSGNLPRLGWVNKLFLLTVSLLLIAVVISFSRTIWFALLLVGGVVLINGHLAYDHRQPEGLVKRFRGNYLRMKWSLPVIIIIALLLSSFLLLRVNNLFGSDWLSLGRRVQLLYSFARMVREHLWMGVGSNQFVLWVDQYWEPVGLIRFAQPVHNAWLLIVAEEGVLGGLTWGTLLAMIVRFSWSVVNKWGGVWLFIALTGVFDHYWWSLPAGLWFIFLTFGLSLATMINREILMREVHINNKDINGQT